MKRTLLNDHSGMAMVLELILVAIIFLIIGVGGFKLYQAKHSTSNQGITPGASLSQSSALANGITVNSPRDGAKVGRRFTISGKVPPSSAGDPIMLLVDRDLTYYLPPENRNPLRENSQIIISSSTDGTFSFPVDLDGQNAILVYDQKSYAVTQQSLAPGEHSFTIVSDGLNVKNLHGPALKLKLE